MCQSPYKQIRAGWSFLVKRRHLNLKLSGFHQCHTPFAQKTHGKGCNLKHGIPASPTQACTSWQGPAQALGGVFWKGKVQLVMTFTAFPELPVHLLHIVKIQTGCDTLFKGAARFHTRHKFSGNSAGTTPPDGELQHLGSLRTRFAFQESWGK